MFGYVRTFRPELKVKDDEQYKGIYCALCKCLSGRYGWLSRFTLSYDFTFLAVLRGAVAADDCCFDRRRCPVHPLKKRTCCRPNPAIEYAADLSMLTVYYRALDSVADNGFWSRTAAKMALPLLRRAKRRAEAAHPETAALIATQIAAQNELEAKQCASVDRAAEPTARMLAAMFADGEPEGDRRRVLEHMGYCLGRWIYLIDAADDLEDDLETGNYNVFVCCEKLQRGDMAAIASTREKMRQTLNASIAECGATYDLLSVRRFDGILRNVWEHGLPAAQKTVFEKKEKTNESKRSL